MRSLVEHKKPSDKGVDPEQQVEALQLISISYKFNCPEFPDGSAVKKSLTTNKNQSTLKSQKPFRLSISADHSAMKS